MPAGDVRINPQTGEVYRLELAGNDLAWVPLEGEEATAAQSAAEFGPVGAFAQGMGEALTFGVLPDQPAMEQQYPGASLAGELFPLGAGLLPGITRRGLALTASRAIESKAASQAPKQLLRRPSDILGRATTTGGAFRIVEATAEAIPGLNLPGIAQKAINQRRINQSFAKAIGLSDESAAGARTGLTENYLDEALANLNAKFRSVEQAIGTRLEQAGARSALESANELGLLPSRLKKVMEGTEPVTGKEIMALRSQLSKIMRGNEGAIVKDRIREQIEAIDDLVAQALKGQDEVLETYRDARTRWRIWANVRVGRGLSPDGQLNPRTVSGRLANNLGDGFRAGRQLQNVPDDVNRFLNIVREGARLDVGLPSSGTAERAVGAAVLGGAIASQ